MEICSIWELVLKYGLLERIGIVVMTMFNVYTLIHIIMNIMGVFNIKLDEFEINRFMVIISFLIGVVKMLHERYSVIGVMTYDIAKLSAMYMLVWLVLVYLMKYIYNIYYGKRIKSNVLVRIKTVVSVVSLLVSVNAIWGI